MILKNANNDTCVSDSLIDGWVEITQGELDAIRASRQSTPNAVADFTAAIQQRLDDFARTRNYDNVDSASKYQNISDAEISLLPVPEQATVSKFRVECRYLALSVARTWATYYAILADVQAGKRPMPTLEQILAELPVLEWPQ